jgi:sec-independent protein translocase protein TatB
MFEIGFSELALIAVVALLVLGPERLPTAARTVGSLLRRARSSWTSLRDEIERELAIKENLDAVKRAAEPMRDSMEKIGHDVASTAREAVELPSEAKPVEPEPTPQPPRHE